MIILFMGIVIASFSTLFTTEYNSALEVQLFPVNITKETCIFMKSLYQSLDILQLEPKDSIKKHQKALINLVHHYMPYLDHESKKLLLTDIQYRLMDLSVQSPLLVQDIIATLKPKDRETLENTIKTIKGNSATVTDYVPYIDMLCNTQNQEIKISELSLQFFEPITHFKPYFIKQILNYRVTKTLSITHTNLKHIDFLGSFFREICPKIIYLYLNNNRIKNVLNISLDAFKRVELLDLADNNIQNIDTLCTLQNLHALYIDNNNLIDLPAKLPLPRLQELSLSHNAIKDIPVTALLYCLSLKVVRLEHNKLKTLRVIMPNSVKYLYLHHNELEKVSKKSISENLKYIALNDNPNLMFDSRIFVSCLGLKNIHIDQKVLTSFDTLFFKLLNHNLAITTYS